MEYNRLGRSGLKVSRLSFGAWVTFHTQVGLKVAQECMALAYDKGVNFFDNAEGYAAGEAEILMGQAIKNLGWARDSYCVSSKVFWGGELPTQRGLSKKHIHDACHGALKRLQVDYLDLYFCHRPDPTTPIEETVLAMNDLITQGKVLYWGTSEWSAKDLTEAYEIAKSWGLRGPTMEQPEYNLFNRKRVEQEYQPLYQEYGLGTTIWSPLCSGWLTGKYQKGIPKDSRFNLKGYEWLKERYESKEGQARIHKVESLKGVAKKLGVSLTQLAIAWCMKNDRVSTVILGASKVDQLEENLESTQVLSLLSDEVMAEVHQILE